MTVEYEIIVRSDQEQRERFARYDTALGRFQAETRLALSAGNRDVFLREVDEEYRREIAALKVGERPSCP